MNEARLWSGRLSVSICVLMCFNSFVLAQDIPAIGNLSANPGGYAGQVQLNWDTPDFNDANLAGPYSYEFRCDSNTIDEVSWEASSVLVGDFPSVVDTGFDVTLDLTVMCNNSQGIAYWDSAYCRAYLTYSYTYMGPGGYQNTNSGLPLCGEQITFEAFDSSDSLVASAQKYTGGYGSTNAGVAEWVSPSLTSYSCANPGPYPMFTLKATWKGGPFSVIWGIGRTSQSKSDSKQQAFCMGRASVGSGLWNIAGGVYDYTLADVNYSCDVPVGAVDANVSVSIAAPNSVPDSNGMSYAVPGAMIAFELESPNDVNLNLPVSVTVGYPLYKLQEYDGLGESSLRGYVYDDANEVWKILDATPTIINRQTHTVTFSIEQLGLFAVAAETDVDGDGLGDFEELKIGTNPTVADTDGDGVSDGNEIWFTGGDPQDARKINGEDQYAVARGLSPGENYYIAARIVGYNEQSGISNNVHVQAADCPANPDLDCSGTVNLEDFAFLASWWLENYP